MRTVLICTRSAPARLRPPAGAAGPGRRHGPLFAATVPELMARLERHPHAIAFADLGFDEAGPVQLVRTACAYAPGCDIVVVGAIDPFTAEKLFHAGAAAVLRSAGADETELLRVAEALALAEDADAAPAPGPVPLQRRGADRPRFTEREVQVLQGMSEGRSNGEIGRDHFISVDTVKTHAKRVFRKLGVRDRAHAVAQALRAGIIE